MRELFAEITAALVARLRARRIRGYLERFERPLVVVHLKCGDSIRGTFTDATRDEIVLEHAAHLSPQGAIALDGEQVLPRSGIKWTQRIETRDGGDE